MTAIGRRAGPLRAVLRAGVLSLAALATGVPAAARAQSSAELEGALAGLSWRSIGPADMGGRTTDIAAIPGDGSVVYFATASGGLWKTANAGTTWRSLFEDGGTLSLGAIALAPSDPNVVYLGSGEGNPRNSTSIGDGVYVSTDAGETWTRSGLEDTERISRIQVHPGRPEVVYVGALGHLWGPSEARGVYRSRDGGRTWEKVLYIDENTGVADLALDASNPRILFAAMWDFRRRPWHFRSGGPGSGLYRSKDGGDTWVPLTDPSLHNGLPAGTLGRIGVRIAPSDPDVVYTIIESEADGVLWRSGDGGDTWTEVSRSRQIGSRPFYYSDIRVDPTDANTVYALASGLYRSIDGGRSWERIAGDIHGDHHALWIDPADPHRLIDGNDGGWHFSYDGGETWELVNTVPLAQFYQIAADDRTPYTVCGGLQDNDVWCGPSATRSVAGVLENYWHEIVGPGDGTYVQFDPRDADIIYAATQGGSLYRVDLSTGEARSIVPYPPPTGGLAAGAHEVRFNWNAPLHLSPHDPDVLYAGGNRLFRTDDGGQSWTPISPDLSRAEPEKLESSGGPITPDNTTAEYHATIYTIAESPLEPGVIWVGTDDGGTSWTELSGRLPGLPRESWISRVEASRHAAGVAFVAVDRHRSDDMAPHLFGTDDYGDTWTDLSAGLPTPGYIHVVREDPRVPGLLYVGTELGMWASPPPAAGPISGDRLWFSLRLGLPPVAVRDLLVHPRDDDLVIGTHGRGAWILDDATPLQQLAAARAAPAGAFLFPPRPAIRYEPAVRRFRSDIGDRVFVGDNPPYGALLSYYLSEEIAGRLGRAGEGLRSGGVDGGAAPAEDSVALGAVKLVILAPGGDTVRVLDGDAEAGVHRVAWDLRYRSPEPRDVEGFRWGAGGPRVLPGRYLVRLVEEGAAPRGGGEAPAARESASDADRAAGDRVRVLGAAEVEVRLDERLETSAADLAAELDALRRAAAVGTAAARTVRELDAAREQLVRWRDRLEGLSDAPAGAADSAAALVRDADSLRVRIAGPRDGEGVPERVPLLSALRSLVGDVGRATARPTAAQGDWLERYAAEWEGVRAGVEAWLERVRRFDALLAAAGLDPVYISPPR